MSSKRNKKRKRRIKQDNLLVFKLLIMVVLVIAIFEGDMIHTMLTFSENGTIAADQQSEKKESSVSEGEISDAADTDNEMSADNPAAVTNDTTAFKPDAPMAGLSSMLSADPSTRNNADSNAADNGTSAGGEVINSPKVVPKQSTPVDDSFFSHSVFIGDSRMEGFRNSSGITQGTFMTSIGLNTTEMASPLISTADGQISVYQGLSGEQYDKIYLMLGTNDLGYGIWDDFGSNFDNIMQQFHELQPNATIYVCSVIYLEEEKTPVDYNNNDNVRIVNGFLLDTCEKFDYCWYLNLNEIFSNGHGGLIADATSDGIHLYEEYCKMMLDYMKTHYVAADVEKAIAFENKKSSEAEGKEDKSVVTVSE